MLKRLDHPQLRPPGLLAAALCAATVWASACLAAGEASTPAATPATLAVGFAREVRPLLDRYCAECHGKDVQKGDLDLELAAPAALAPAQRPLWLRTLQKLKARQMPPAKHRQLDDDERERITAWIGALRRSDPPDPGRVTSRRLNRSAYDRTIHDLFGIDFRPAADFPADDVGDGFDGDGDVLSLSPLLMEKYLFAADAILDRVVVDDRVDLHWSGSELVAVVDGKAQERAADPAAGKPQPCALSGPGEAVAMLPVPNAAAYTIRFKAAAETAGGEPARVVVRIDGVAAYECRVSANAKSPAAYAFTTTLTPGQKRLSLVFINPVATPVASSATPPGTHAAPGAPARAVEVARPRRLLIDSVDVQGPPAAPLTAAHRRLFTATPGPGLAKREAARRIATDFAARAYRHPPDAAQLDLLLRVFDLADAQDAPFSAAVKLMIKAALISPSFLLRIEEERPPGADGAYAIGDYDLAVRLSYFLWSTMPDEQLTAAAAAGTLHQPTVLAGEVRRMLADPRARALTDDFAGQWLQLRNVFIVEPDRTRFPGLTRELRQAMYDEGALLFAGVLQNKGSLLELLDCDYTYVNADLARFYGMAGITGRQMRRVPLEDRDRGGILTLPALLMVTSHPTRTSPVKRGRWVLEEILGTPPPPPPPLVAALDQQDQHGGVGLSMRQKLERHRSDPACASCHAVMDQIGFGLEGFDAIGHARTRDDAGALVDTSGELPGGRRFSTPDGLKRLLLTYRDDFARTFIARLLGYALGRRLQDADERVIDAIARASAADGYRLDGIVMAVATSYPFLNRRAASAP